MFKKHLKDVQKSCTHNITQTGKSVGSASHRHKLHLTWLIIMAYRVSLWNLYIYICTSGAWDSILSSSQKCQLITILTFQT